MLAKALARSLDCELLPPPVHAGPAAVGRHRRQRLQPARERVRVPARARLRQPPARRRGQPRVAEDAVRAARVHAGAPGDRRRRQLPARRVRSWSWRRRTRSSTRARTRCPRRSSTASRCALSLGYPPLADEARMLTQQTVGPAARRRSSRSAAPTTWSPWPRTRKRCTSRRASTATSSRVAPAHARRPASLPRREPARGHRAAARREGAGARGRPRLRLARRRQGGRGARARAPPDRRARGARRRRSAPRSSSRDAIEKTPVPV